MTEEGRTPRWVTASVILQVIIWVFFAGTVYAQIKSVQAKVGELEDRNLVLLDRQQLEDILRADRKQMQNIEDSLKRLETRLDSIYGQ